MTELARPDLHAAIEQRYPDNTTERITPELLRDGLHELVDSVAVKASDGGAVPNVPLYKAGTDYAKDYTVHYPTGTGVDAFYYSLRAGKLPAPSGSSADVNWKVVPGPVSTAALSQQLTLTQAQGIEGSQVVPGRSYIIDFGPDANGNAQLVTLLGTASNLFAIRGQLTVAGVRSNVRVNMASGVFGVETFDAYTKAETDALLTTKAALDANYLLAVEQLPAPGFGVIKDQQGRYAINDRALLQGQVFTNIRVDPTSGRYLTKIGWTTIQFAANQGVTYKSDQLKLYYATYQSRTGLYQAPWYVEPVNNTIAYSFTSKAPTLTFQGSTTTEQIILSVSVENKDLPYLHIAPLSGYDDTNLKAELAKRVKTINGVGPDAAGNVQVAASTAPGTGGPGAATAADVQAGTSSDTYISPQALAQSSEDLYTWIRDVPEDVQSNVENTANWDAYSRYLGPAVPAGLNGKIHYFMPAAGLGVARYKFEFIEDNQVVRYLISTNP